MAGRGGAEWAASSARTLARRLRRVRAREEGPSQARALAFRTKVLHKVLSEHWKLQASLGLHVPTLREAVAAAELVGARESLAELREATTVDCSSHSLNQRVGVPTHQCSLWLVSRLKEWHSRVPT